MKKNEMVEILMKHETEIQNKQFDGVVKELDTFLKVPVKVNTFVWYLVNGFFTEAVGFATLNYNKILKTDDANWYKEQLKGFIAEMVKTF